MRTKLILFLIFTLSQQAIGQQYEDEGRTLINVIPPAPTAAQMKRYVDHPVSLSNGTPNVEIPLYNLQSRELSIPLSLSYHASGIKVNDIATNVGLGWSFNGGGTITRVLKGLPDDHLDKIKTSGEILNENNYEYLYRMYMGEIDPYRDQYYYSFNGHSGSFYLDLKTMEVIQVPKTDNIIKATKVLTTDPYIPYNIDFEISTTDGNKYYFGLAENVTYYGSDLHTYFYESTWHLTKVESYNKTDQIIYEYEDDIDWSNVIRFSVMIYGGTTEVRSEGINILHKKRKRLKQITCSSGKIVITHKTDRQDADNSPPFKSPRSRISDIKIYDLNNRLIRSIEFDNNQYFPGKRMKLKGLTVYGSNKELVDKYSFNYYDEETNCSYNNAQDMFGYYNGKNSNSNLLHNNNSRTYNFICAKHHSLYEIKGITGETTRYTYEARTLDLNYAPYGENERYDISFGIGIRVKKIEILDRNESIIRAKRYEYGQPYCDIDFTKLDGGIFISSHIFYSYDQNGGYPDPGSGAYSSSVFGIEINACNFQSSSVAPGLVIENANLFYKSVNEYTYADGSPESRIDYEFYVPQSNYMYSDIGKFSNPDNGTLWLLGYNVPWRYGKMWITGYHMDNRWMWGHQTRKTIYTYDNGNYNPLERITNTYENKDMEDIHTGLYDRYLFRAVPNINWGLSFKYSLNSYNYFDVLQYTGRKVLMQTKIEKFAGGSAIAEQRNYDYRKNSEGRITSNLLEKETVTVNGGDTYETTYYYPGSTGYTILGPYPQMERDNYLPLVKAVTKKNGTAYSTRETVYSTFSGKIYPSEYKKLVGTSLSESYRIKSYNQLGNPTVVSWNDQPDTYYVWSYNGLYPVAEIKNAAGVLSSASLTSYFNNTVPYYKILPALWSNTIAPLRTQFPEAMFTFYEHYPLTGIKSVTDPSGRRLNYEYDGAGRLTKIRDEDNYIIEGYEYNYQNR